MTEHTLFESETETNRRTAAALLRNLADGVDAGQISFSEGEESVTIDVAADLTVEVEAERETDDEDGAEEEPAEVEVEVELEWDEPEGPVDPDAESASEASTDDDGAESDSDADAAEPDADGVEASAADAVAAVLPGEDAPLASLGTFQVYRDRADEWRWRLVHRNGNVIAASGEGYTTRRNAEKGMRSVMQNAPGAEVERHSGSED